MNTHLIINNITEYKKDPIIKSLDNMAVKLKELSLPISIEYKKGTVKYIYKDSYYELLDKINKIRNQHIELYYKN